MSLSWFADYPYATGVGVGLLTLAGAIFVSRQLTSRPDARAPAPEINDFATCIEYLGWIQQHKIDSGSEEYSIYEILQRLKVSKNTLAEYREMHDASHDDSDDSARSSEEELLLRYRATMEIEHINTDLKPKYTKAFNKAMEYIRMREVQDFDESVNRVAKFLAYVRPDKTLLGEYLGVKKSKKRNERDFNVEVMKAFIARMDLRGVGTVWDIVDAFRYMCTVFVIPGEGQKVGRIMDGFGAAFYAQNVAHLVEEHDRKPPEAAAPAAPEATAAPQCSCLFGSTEAPQDRKPKPERLSVQDSVDVLANALLILNSSLHNSSAKQMTKKDLIGMLADARLDEKYNLPMFKSEFFVTMYDRVLANEIVTYPPLDEVDDPSGGLEPDSPFGP